MLEYLETFNSLQSKIKLVCKNISSDLFKNMIIYKLLIYLLYVYPFNSM